jgi:galactokinase/mevalonate kinase-like predicted kinase
VHFGRLLHSASTAKKKVSDRISNPQVDELYEETRKKGAIGAKVTGAGNGGYMTFYCEFEKKHRVAEQLRKMTEGDIAIGLSTSDNSRNILRAMETAKAKRIITVGLTRIIRERTRDGNCVGVQAA